MKRDRRRDRHRARPTTSSPRRTRLSARTGALMDRYPLYPPALSRRPSDAMRRACDSEGRPSADDGLGRLHRRRAPARPAADHRAAARRAGTRSSSPPASTGRRSGSSTGSGCPTPSVGEHGGASTLGKARALGGALGAARPSWSGRSRPELAIAHGSVDLAVVSVRCRDPLGADAGLRVRRPAAPDRLPGRRAGCWSRTRSRSTGWRKIGAKERKLVRYPGLKEEYYLADFEPDPAVLDELGLDREQGDRRRCGRRRRPPSTTPRNDVYAATIAPPRRRRRRRRR